MKITKQQLKKIIQEEIQRVVSEKVNPFSDYNPALAIRPAMMGSHTKVDKMPGEPGSEERERALADLMNHQIEFQHTLGDLLEFIKNKFPEEEDQITKPDMGEPVETSPTEFLDQPGKARIRPGGVARGVR